jgi:hypothetical protein
VSKHHSFRVIHNLPSFHCLRWHTLVHECMHNLTHSARSSGGLDLLVSVLTMYTTTIRIENLAACCMIDLT